MSSAVDLFFLYKFLSKLTTPFKEWEAFEKGIIDAQGNIIKSKRERGSDRSSFTKFDLMVLKLKKLIEKIPGGSNRTSKYAAALWFIKEHMENEDSVLTERKFQQYYKIAKNVQLNENFNSLFEEPTVSVGSGQVDGIGVGEKGEPGFTSRQMNKYKRKNSMFTRKKLKKDIPNV